MLNGYPPEYATLAGKDDLGEREEEAEYCFKDFHKLEGFFNF